jgi:predicted nuclease of predicted toxin-antitoxin system
VRLLVDQNIAARVADLLRGAGHVSELGLQHAEDDEILRVALAQERVIVSEDTDFAGLLARAGARSPSFVLIRSAAPMTPDAQAFLLVATLPRLVGDLEAGCIAGRGTSPCARSPASDQAGRRPLICACSGDQRALQTCRLRYHATGWFRR